MFPALPGLAEKLSFESYEGMPMLQTGNDMRTTNFRFVARTAGHGLARWSESNWRCTQDPSMAAVHLTSFDLRVPS